MWIGEFGNGSKVAVGQFTGVGRIDVGRNAEWNPGLGLIGRDGKQCDFPVVSHSDSRLRKHSLEVLSAGNVE